MTADEEPRLERVVVGVDYRPPSLEALRWARDVLAPDAEMVAVYASDTGQPPTSEPPAVGVGDAGALESALAGVRMVVRADADPAPTVIAAVAEESGADVIVVGSRGAGAPESSRLGSTAERLIRISPVPVVHVAGSHASRPARLLVPVDGSELTSPVLAWTALLAGRWGASVTLLHVVTDDLPPGAAAQSMGWLEQVAVELRRAGGERIADIVTAVAAGKPGPTVLQAAGRARPGMIVMGRRGAGRTFSGLMGSTASTVLRGADCPVLVVVDPPFAVIDG